MKGMPETTIAGAAKNPAAAIVGERRVKPQTGERLRKLDL